MQVFDTPEAAILEIARPDKKAPAPDAIGLTPIWLSIMSDIVLGRSQQEIEIALSIDEDALEHHLAGIFAMTGVSNRLELVLFTVHNGMITDK